MMIGLKESMSFDQVISRNNNSCWLAYKWAIWMPWWPDQIAVEHVLLHILNLLESFRCQKHKEKGQKFVSRAVIRINFNNKRKLRVIQKWRHDGLSLKICLSFYFWLVFGQRGSSWTFVSVPVGVSFQALAWFSHS